MITGINLCKCVTGMGSRERVDFTERRSFSISDIEGRFSDEI